MTGIRRNDLFYEDIRETSKRISYLINDQPFYLCLQVRAREIFATDSLNALNAHKIGNMCM